MGACTFTKTANTPVGVWGNNRVAKGQLALSASYATGGDTLDLKTVGLTELNELYVNGSNALLGGSGLSVALGGTKIAPLIIASDALNTEVANATNLSTRPLVQVLLVGK